MATITEKVLIIEDSKAEAGALAYRLMDAYQIPSDIARSLTETKTLLSQAQNTQYISAVVDLNLPDAEMGAAFELTKQHGIPIIIFTGEIDYHLRERFTSDNLADFVFKSGEHDFKYVCWLINRLSRNRKLKVLVVDDSQSARMTLTSLIKHQGFEVFEAPDAQSALKLMPNNPDIVVVDLYLPDMLGSELSRQIRRDFPSDTRQIMGVSSKSDARSSVLLLKNGCDDFLPRPFNFDEFIYRLNQRAQHIDNLKELHRLNQEKNRLLGMAAHDLRNPASAISHAVGRMKSLKLEDKTAQRALDIIQRSCDAMDVLLSDLLDISAIETGRLELKKQPINLCALIKERIEHFEPYSKKKGIALTHSVPDSAMADVDAIRISQVVDNLISNAIKYSPGETQVTVTLEKKANGFVLSVMDEGPGIEEKDIESLFTAFNRLGHSTTGGESSHGLGLAICSKIIQAHGGSIGYKNAVPHGSHFFVELPK